jgi:ketosteroid isomerase-like protein
MTTNETDGALAAFRRYTDAFQALDPRAVAPHFNQPALFISPEGIVTLPTTADVERMYRGVMAELPAQGYARTDFSQLVEHRLAPDLALVTGVGVWRTASARNSGASG